MSNIHQLNLSCYLVKPFPFFIKEREDELEEKGEMTKKKNSLHLFFSLLLFNQKNEIEN